MKPVILREQMSPYNGAVSRTCGVSFDRRGPEGLLFWFTTQLGELAVFQQKDPAHGDILSIVNELRALGRIVKRSDVSGFDVTRYFADRSPMGGLWYRNGLYAPSVPGFKGPRRSLYSYVHAVHLSGLVKVDEEPALTYKGWSSLSTVEKRDMLIRHWERIPKSGYYMAKHPWEPPRGQAVDIDDLLTHTPSDGCAKLLDHLVAWNDNHCRPGFSRELVDGLNANDRSMVFAMATRFVMAGDARSVRLLCQTEPSNGDALPILEQIAAKEHLAEGDFGVKYEAEETRVHALTYLWSRTGNSAYRARLVELFAHPKVGWLALSYATRVQMDAWLRDYLLELAKNGETAEIRRNAGVALTTETLADDMSFNSRARIASALLGSSIETGGATATEAKQEILVHWEKHKSVMMRVKDPWERAARAKDVRYTTPSGRPPGI